MNPFSEQRSGNLESATWKRANKERHRFQDIGEKETKAVNVLRCLSSFALVTAFISVLSNEEAKTFESDIKRSGNRRIVS
jgi:hypothetical protein